MCHCFSCCSSTEAVNPSGGIATGAPAAAPSKPKSGWPSRRPRSKKAAGRKRAAAELSEDEGAAAASDEEASPAQQGQQQQQQAEQQQQQDRSGLRRSAAGHRAWLADLSDDEAQAGVARMLPARAAAEASPAGVRRQRRRLTEGNDALAQLADAAARAADGEAPAVAIEAQQAAGSAAAAAGEVQQAAGAAAAAAAAAGEVQHAAGPAGEAQQAAGGAGEPAFQLPAHLQKARAATLAAQQKRAARVENSRQGPPPSPFRKGDNVTLWVEAKGRVGRSVDRKRLPCRVVGVKHAFGKQIRYTLRCNAGVLKRTYAEGVEAATAADAAALTFRGSAGSGPGIKVGITPEQGLKEHAQIPVITV